MTIVISGKHMEVGDSLSTHTHTKMTDTFNRYLGHVPEITVTFSKFHHFFNCEVSVRLEHHFIIHCKGQDTDAYHSLDKTIQKIDSRLKRYRARLRKKSHHPKTSAKELWFANHYIVDVTEEDSGADIPVVIAEIDTEVEELKVSEAVMRLDLTEKPVLIFKNESNGRLNVVFRRHDGHIGWVDPNSPPPINVCEKQ